MDDLLHTLPRIRPRFVRSSFDLSLSKVLSIIFNYSLLAKTIEDTLLDILLVTSFMQM